MAYSQEDQYQHAKAALMQGRSEDAKQLYCSLAASYPNYKNARAMCTMLQTKGAQGSDYDSFYELGVRLFNEGDYDESAEAFQKVRGGSHRDDAKDYLLYRLPQARLKAAEAASAPPPAPAVPQPAAPSPAAKTEIPEPRRPAIEKKMAATPPKPASKSALADALTEYYAGQFDKSEADIQAYLQQSPKDSVAQFYLGVCRLTRYYITPEKNRSQDLLVEAQAAFRIAKQAGFTPIQKYVSPKILQVYASTTP
jgi:tetratricopeptide (TPR) repeat protein